MWMFIFSPFQSVSGVSRSALVTVIGVCLLTIGALTGVIVMLVANSSQRVMPLAEIRLVERADSVGRNTATSPIISSSFSLSTAFRNVANSAVPSVVSISSEAGWHAHLWSSFDSDEMYENEGSGVVITPQGHIVTNYHLVKNSRKLQVLFADKREFEAYTIGVDRSTDLAVIQVILNPEESVPAMTLGDSETLQLGDWVLAIGNPLQLNSTVTAGIVSAMGRSMNIIDSNFGVEDFIQTDAAINPGNSGGALMNLQGKLIGINTAIVTNSGFYEGYGFAIPINLAIRVVTDLIEFGEFRRAFMGVIPTDVDAEFASALGMNSVRGVFLDQVYEGGAADVAGLRAGDVILEIDGHPIDQPNQLLSTVLQKRPYSKALISYWRSGKIDTLNLTLLGQDHPRVASWLLEMGYRPTREVRQAHYLDQWGLVLRDKFEEDETVYGELEGVIIQRITRQTPIEYLEEGGLLEHINGQKINSVEDARNELQNIQDVARLSVRDQWNVNRMVVVSILDQ